MEENINNVYQEEMKKPWRQLLAEAQARERSRSSYLEDVRIIDSGNMPVVKREGEIGISGKLTLNEMLLLAEKVENWRADYTKLRGSIQDINFEMDWDVRFFSKPYWIRAKSKEISLGEYKYKDTTSSGKEIKLMYNKSFMNIEENEKKAREDEQKEIEKKRQDTLNYAKSLI